MDYKPNSRKLGANTLKEMGIKRESLIGTGNQAHHIIPLELVKMYDIENAKFYDDVWNCLYILSEQDGIVHNGSHPEYTQYIYEIIIDICTDSNYTFYGAALLVANGVKKWYNEISTKVRKSGFTFNINEIKQIEQLAECSVIECIQFPN